MIRLFAKLFIKDYKDYKKPAVRTAYGVLSGIVGIVLNIILFTGKFIAGSLSGSISITADAFNNLSDAASSIITLVGFKMANQKPDPDHPFGHGRIEYVSGLIVAMLILLMAFELIQGSVDKILHPKAIQANTITVVILIASILIKLYMSYYNRSLAKKINSTSLRATAADSISDSISTLVVLICTLIFKFLNVNLDAYAGILVGAFIFYTGINAAKETINPLLGQSPDEEFVKQISDFVMKNPLVLGIHDLIVHDYGPGRVMISLHAEVPASGNILEIHDMIDNIEHELSKTLDCHVVIHMDPVQNDDELTITLKKEILSILYDIDPIITMHDFRIVTGPTHTNLIFDIVIPFGYHINDQDLQALIQSEVTKVNSTYFTVIDIDKEYSIKK